MSSGQKCRSENYATCEEKAVCTGKQAECPKSEPMPDGRGCIERGQCRSGECIPYCETQGLQSCMCDTEKDACMRCCRRNLNSTCFPIMDEQNKPDPLKDGTPCYQGSCNKVSIINKTEAFIFIGKMQLFFLAKFFIFFSTFYHIFSYRTIKEFINNEKTFYDRMKNYLFCFQGQCERTMQDVVERIWDFIDDFNINSVLKFLKDNIVGTVVIVSLIFWVPISCLISYVDNKRAKKVNKTLSAVCLQ